MHETIKGLAASAARLTAAVDRLTDAEVREPTALPGWTRAHAIAHIARSIDAYLWLLALARTGVEPGPRQTGAQIGQAVEEWAARPAAELAADLADRVAVLLAAAEAMPEERWEYLVSALAGWRHPAWYTLLRARREIETHHVDLAVGYRPADWPADYVAWALDETLTALHAREFPLGRVSAADLGRSWEGSGDGVTVHGDGHALLAWLAGRESADALTTGALTADGPLPEPPSWPLPPTPGWN
ncbi:maleylpyruvate isomerase family mycothiol-dependent enzyme [Kitasatospora acidiphila]|uniref:Maleylpyruvate isomerase family mycothiol-dependent enzyme n=1 Tax=Kitasatospora acidiphila TaxID=2567942 RepID=A0A540W8Y9_9ACTN|nr:maleylpyruvate isomerase family mycothiol-dependent enzyme [Kitasatospora acidiphila]TQF05485.1 maleylpyruvate isomerase family mycothiol-dependent enzyme [Kitasatospora acidiphila]